VSARSERKRGDVTVVVAAAAVAVVERGIAKERSKGCREDAGSESVGDSCRGVAGSISVDRRHKLFQWTQSSGSIVARSFSLHLAVRLVRTRHPRIRLARSRGSIRPSFPSLSSYRAALTAALSHPGAFVSRLRVVASSFNGKSTKFLYSLSLSIISIPFPSSSF